MRNFQLPYSWALVLVIVLHVVGFFGWHSSWSSVISLLTPVHLLISFWLLFQFSGATTTLRFRLLLVYAIGLGVEFLGVHTGYPFGVYTYLEGLGPLVWDVPWMPDYDTTQLFTLSASATGLAFVAIGILKARVNSRPILRSVGETVLLGALAAVLAYAAGDVLESWLA